MSFATIATSSRHFKRAGLPSGPPQLDEPLWHIVGRAGHEPRLLDPLMNEWLRSAVRRCRRSRPSAAPRSTTTRAFVVAYRLGEDEHLSEHFDNAEITLNANLGRSLSGRARLLRHHRRARPNPPVAYHDWADDYGVGHAVLHLGAQVHAALPIASG